MKDICWKAFLKLPIERRFAVLRRSSEFMADFLLRSPERDIRRYLESNQVCIVRFHAAVIDTVQKLHGKASANLLRDAMTVDSAIAQ